MDRSHVFAWCAVFAFTFALCALWLAYYEPDDETPPRTTTTVVDLGDAADRDVWAELETIRPVSPSTTVPPASDRTYLETLVRRVFPEDPTTAFAIVNAESAWNPAAVSETDDWGLFQVNAVHLEPGEAADGFTRADLLDPLLNVTTARRIYDQAGGWYPWSTYRHFRN